jgi:hypothetical protein
VNIQFSVKYIKNNYIFIYIEAVRVVLIMDVFKLIVIVGRAQLLLGGIRIYLCELL